MNIKHTPLDSDKYNAPVQVLHPKPRHVAGLRTLWKEAFGDEDTFLDIFFSTAFSPERCLCILIENNVVAALYWFQCEYLEQPLAYIYAVATAKAYRGRGLCHKLLAATHSALRQQSYIGALLVPGSESLFDFYKKAGYQTTCYRYTYKYNLNKQINQADLLNQTSSTLSLSAASIFPVTQISASEYASLRKNFLPPESVLQEKDNLAFLQTQLNFYSGENFLAAIAITEQTLYCPEFLYTDTTAISSENILADNPYCQNLMNLLLSYFDCTSGAFCTPGGNSPYAMYYPLDNHAQRAPSYFAFAFD